MQDFTIATAHGILGDWADCVSLTCLVTILQKLDALYEHKPVCPCKGDVFKAFRLCPPDKCKVVMLGQDPYFQKDRATGIAFANSGDTPEDKWSPSLRVLRNAAVDLQVPHNLVTFDPTLESWESQGVLLLNSALTVEMNRPGSHITLWRDFIATFFTKLSLYDRDMLFVLMGATARTFKPYIYNRRRIIEADHPSCYARTGKDMPSDIFYRINHRLKEQYNATIEWYKEDTI